MRNGESLVDEVRALRAENRRLADALPQERERAAAEQRRADALAAASRSAWRVGTYGKRAETP